MTKKEKYIVKDLNTGKETVHYFDKENDTNSNWIEDYVKDNPAFKEKRILESLKPKLPINNIPKNEAFETIQYVYNRTKLHTNPLREVRKRINELQSKLQIIEYPALSEIRNIYKEIQLQNSLSYNNVKTVVENIEVPKLLLFIRDTQNILRQFLKQAKKKKQHSTKARKYESEVKGMIKISNQILGFVCFFSNYFQTKEIKKLLTIFEIEITDTTIKAVQRYRNKAVNFNLCLDNNTISLRETTAKLRTIENAYIVMQAKKLKGKTKATSLKNKIINKINPL